MSCYVVGAKIFAAPFPPPGEEKTFQHLSLRLKEIEITMKMKIGVRNEGTEAGNKKPLGGSSQHERRTGIYRCHIGLMAPFAAN